MTINGKEFDIDFTDADTIERIDFKKKDVESKIEELYQNKKNLAPADGIRQECAIIKEFLDYVLGDGASETIFGNKDSLKLCLNAFKDIVDGMETQQNEMSEIISKYSPDRFKR